MDTFFWNQYVLYLPLCSYHKSPKVRAQQLENLQIAFNFMHANGINLVNTSESTMLTASPYILFTLAEYTMTLNRGH